MKMHYFEHLSSHVELIHGSRWNGMFLVGTSANAEIDGSITWQILQLDPPGILKRMPFYCGSWNDLEVH
jgi:hypothetical protein